MINIALPLNTSIKTGRDGVPNVTNGDIVAIALQIPADATPGAQYRIMADEYGDSPVTRWFKLSSTAGDLNGAQANISAAKVIRVGTDVQPGALVYFNVLAHNPAKMPPPNVRNTNMIIDYRTS